MGKRSAILISFSHAKSDVDRSSGMEKKSPKPDVWRSKCSTDTFVQLAGAPGKYLGNRSSNETRPASTRIMIAVAVNGFVTDANSKIVCSDAGVDSSTFAKPYPFARTTFPCRTTQTDIPGTRFADSSVFRYASATLADAASGSICCAAIDAVNSDNKPTADARVR
jgi:hypothetical protein